MSFLIWRFERKKVKRHLHQNIAKDTREMLKQIIIRFNGMLRHRQATFEGAHKFLVFSTALLLLEESPLSFVAGSCSLFFTSAVSCTFACPRACPRAGNECMNQVNYVCVFYTLSSRALLEGAPFCSKVSRAFWLIYLSLQGIVNYNSLQLLNMLCKLY